MTGRNIIFIVISYIVIVVLCLFFETYQFKSILQKNNELIEGKLEKSIDSQLKLKNRPIVDFSFSNIGHKKILLTKDQLNLINQNIAVNTAKVDDAISTSKEEINRDISRISTLVAIVLATIGFLGIFIPILLNLYSTRDLERRMSTTEIQLLAANELLLNTQTLSTTAIAVAQSATTAANDSTTATKVATDKVEILATLMYFLDVLSKLKMLDFMRFSNIESREIYMKSYFIKICNCLKSCKQFTLLPSENVIFKESCIDFSITLYQLMIYIGANRNVLENLKKLINLLEDFINADEANIISKYDEVILLLEELGTVNP